MRVSRLLRLGGSAAHGHGGTASKEYGGASSAVDQSGRPASSPPPSSRAGFHPPNIDPRLEHLATFMGTVMWFWIFYRAKEDGAALIGACPRRSLAFVPPPDLPSPSPRAFALPLLQASSSRGTRTRTMSTMRRLTTRRRMQR